MEGASIGEGPEPLGLEDPRLCPSLRVGGANLKVELRGGEGLKFSNFAMGRNTS